ncbi:MAG: hypothetical protein OXI87_16240 [Albidovulum sp.]|nr:hypothetical protein [Albidovulum sp.]MDE0532217.1 hypothetical protein [Albidovulum sp.]
MKKSLDQKLESIRRGRYTPSDFIIADAKDSDMGGGITAFGPADDGSGHCKSFHDYLAAIRSVATTGLVDITLMSASAAERLAGEKLFENSTVTPAVRLNDATDVWGPRHSCYKSFPARDFRSARIDRVCRIADIGLYSTTFSNDLESDWNSLSSFHRFLDDLAGTDLRYFLEVFNPKIDIGIGKKELPAFVNDCIVRSLAGLTQEDRPQFLKIPFNGPWAMEELCRYDPGHLIVGVLGGGAGTSRDTFELVRQSEKFGARVALFGRKILFSEDSAETIKLMRAVVQGELNSKEAVKAFHAHLHAEGISPKRSLEEDIQITEAVLMHDL